MMTPMPLQHLIFDADDTLWENNIHFERAIEDFLDFLAHSTLTREEARAVLDEIERANFARPRLRIGRVQSESPSLL